MNLKPSVFVLLVGTMLSLSNLDTIVLAKSVFPISAIHQQTLNPLDSEFMTKAAQGNLTEVKVGQLALSRSENPQTQALASHLVQDHQKANADLVQIAQNLKITLPQEADSKHQVVYNELSCLRGTGFDRAFLVSMYHDHTDAIALFTQEAQAGRNPQLKQYAVTYLPSLRQHQAQVVAAGEQMNINVATDSQTLPKECPATFMPTRQK